MLKEEYSVTLGGKQRNVKKTLLLMCKSAQIHEGICPSLVIHTSLMQGLTVLKSSVKRDCHPNKAVNIFARNTTNTQITYVCEELVLKC